MKGDGPGSMLCIDNDIWLAKMRVYEIIDINARNFKFMSQKPLTNPSNSTTTTVREILVRFVHRTIFVKK